MHLTISGYTTTYNCIEMEYPFELCIRSMLSFCDEVVVVDAGSTDGTKEVLKTLAEENPSLKVYIEPVDFSHPRWAIHQDGYLKAKARSRCSMNYCWQMDSDEIVPENCIHQIRPLVQVMQQNNCPLLMLPMVEFWGSFEKIRGDFFTWKARISRNDPNITHGIPAYAKLFDANGNEYVKPYVSDSCNYIFRHTQEDVPCSLPTNVSIEQYDRMSPTDKERFFYASLDAFPHVLHVSWLNLERKIRHYRTFWHKFHASMYGVHKEDNRENNCMFDKPWKEVTDDDIALKAKELKKIGPRSFHYKIDYSQRGLTFDYKRDIPPALRIWAEQSVSSKSSQKPSIEQKREQRVSVNESPLVSIIIPAYNKSLYLRESVGSAIAQTYSNTEIIIVNDGSTDNTKEVAQDIIASSTNKQITLLNKPNGGVSSARNFGISRASGEYIMCLDGDDIALPQFIEKAMPILLSGTANLVTCNVEVFGHEEGEWIPRDYDPYFIRYNNDIPTLVIYEKELWEKTGGYKTALQIVEDWEFFINSTRYGLKAAKLPEKLFRYRSTTSGLAKTFQDKHPEVLALMMTCNEDLYPVTEVLWAINHLIHNMPEGFAEKFREQETKHPDSWLINMWLGLKAEGNVESLQEAVQRYLKAVSLTNISQWIPIYRLGAIAEANGKWDEAIEFYHKVRFLRPDMSKAMEEGITRAAAKRQERKSGQI